MPTTPHCMVGVPWAVLCGFGGVGLWLHPEVVTGQGPLTGNGVKGGRAIQPTRCATVPSLVRAQGSGLR